jgi:hypothetical protein
MFSIQKCIKCLRFNITIKVPVGYCMWHQQLNIVLYVDLNTWRDLWLLNIISLDFYRMVISTQQCCVSVVQRLSCNSNFIISLLFLHSGHSRPFNSKCLVLGIVFFLVYFSRDQPESNLCTPTFSTKQDHEML